MSASEVIDCRSEQGILIGLVDGIISQARVVARHLRAGAQVGDGLTAALTDLAGDEDIALLLAGPGGADPKETRE